MIPTSFALLLALLNLIIACVIGVLLGFVWSLVFRLPWNIGTATLDVVIAALCSIAVVSTYVLISLCQRNFQGGVKWIFVAAALGVVLRQLVRLAMRAFH